MDLDRATVARLDRRLLAGLGRDEQFQMVRVPVTQRSGRRGSVTARPLGSQWAAASRRWLTTSWHSC